MNIDHKSTLHYHLEVLRLTSLDLIFLTRVETQPYSIFLPIYIRIYIHTYPTVCCFQEQYCQRIEMKLISVVIVLLACVLSVTRAFIKSSSRFISKTQPTSSSSSTTFLQADLVDTAEENGSFKILACKCHLYNLITIILILPVYLSTYSRVKGSKSCGYLERTWTFHCPRPIR